MKKLLLFTCFLLSVNSYAYNLVAECNGCSDAQSRQKAIQLANGGFVYVFNFSDHELKKYFAWKENLSKASNSSKDIIKEKYKYLKSLGISEKQIINIFDNLDQSSSTKSVITLVIEVTPTSQESESFVSIDFGFNTFSSWGTLSGDFPSYITDPSGNWIGEGFGAYDLIGNRGLGPYLFNQINDAFSNRVLSMLEALEYFSGALSVLNLKYTVKIIVTFPDGSKGIMTLNEYGELEFDDSSFIDSDGNRVPESAGDVGGRRYNFSGGQNSDNLNDFTDRLTLIGVSSGGSGSGKSCTWSCDSSGNCTLTCKRN